MRVRLSQSDSDGSGYESEEEEDTGKKKGVAGLIEVKKTSFSFKTLRSIVAQLHLVRLSYAVFIISEKGFWVRRN
jgi:hypothetical protein